MINIYLKQFFYQLKDIVKLTKKWYGVFHLIEASKTKDFCYCFLIKNFGFHTEICKFCLCLILEISIFDRVTELIKSIETPNHLKPMVIDCYCLGSLKRQDFLH